MESPIIIKTIANGDRISIHIGDELGFGPHVTLVVVEGNARFAASLLDAAQLDTLIAALTEARRAIS
jgi:hypothetical protein